MVNKPVNEKETQQNDRASNQLLFHYSKQNVQIKDKATVIQNHIVKKDARLSKALTKQTFFYVILSVTHLKNKDEVETMKNVFINAITPFRNEFAIKSLEITFQGLGMFNEQILYARLKNEPIFKKYLYPVLEKIIEEAKESGIKFDSPMPWQPHLTILKLTKNPILMREVKFVHL